MPHIQATSHKWILFRVLLSLKDILHDFIPFCYF